MSKIKEKEDEMMDRELRLPPDRSDPSIINHLRRIEILLGYEGYDNIDEEP